MINPERQRTIKEGTEGSGPVVYWMSRDQRARDNWALLVAQEMAIQRRRPLMVAFCLVPKFLEATIRQYGFMLRGLQALEENLLKKSIPFALLMGPPEREIPRFLEKQKAAVLVTDFDPLRLKRLWKRQVAETAIPPFIEVDAHNIVPCWLASPKQEYAAYTFRPKIQRLLPKFLEPFPTLRKHPVPAGGGLKTTNWTGALKSLRINRSVTEVDWIGPGESSGRSALGHFLRKKLGDYDARRNDPTAHGQSDLSPYLHFGQLSAQRVALEAEAWDENMKAQESFLEELVVRRELSDNFCYYNAHYDTFEAFPDWARRTLEEHREDPREYLYGLEQFEAGETHDELWNAAQLEMVQRGKMHGYMRMYWAKKILEWTESPEQALEIAIVLNDRYELDGRDPNGYAGVAWSIGAVHDRAWGERAVFGKVRYMSYNGCRSKFDVKEYIRRFSTAGKR